MASLQGGQSQQPADTLGSREAFHQAGQRLGGAPSVRLLGTKGPARKPLMCCVEHERRDAKEA